jgi:hypothetical protein
MNQMVTVLPTRNLRFPQITFDPPGALLQA